MGHIGPACRTIDSWLIIELLMLNVLVDAVTILTGGEHRGSSLAGFVLVSSTCPWTGSRRMEAASEYTARLEPSSKERR
jgi:hypothetical protein